MIDEKIKRVKTYIRQRLTEEEEDASDWTKYFYEAVRAQNDRVHKVLYNQAPDELYDEDTGLPEDMDAKNTIFALQKDSAKKFAKNKRKHERKVEALQAAGFMDVTADDCNRLFSGFAPEAGAANFLKEYGQPL